MMVEVPDAELNQHTEHRDDTPAALGDISSFEVYMVDKTYSPSCRRPAEDS